MKYIYRSWKRNIRVFRSTRVWIKELLPPGGSFFVSEGEGRCHDSAAAADPADPQLEALTVQLPREPRKLLISWPHFRHPFHSFRSLQRQGLTLLKNRSSFCLDSKNF